MSIFRSAEFASWVRGISVITEDDGSLLKRLGETQAYFHRREELASQAVTDLIKKGEEGPAADSVRWFAIQARWERTYHMPKVIPNRRWLDIGGFIIPIPPQKTPLTS